MGKGQAIKKLGKGQAIPVPVKLDTSYDPVTKKNRHDYGFRGNAKSLNELGGEFFSATRIASLATTGQAQMEKAPEDKLKELNEQKKKATAFEREAIEKEIKDTKKHISNIKNAQRRGTLFHRVSELLDTGVITQENLNTEYLTQNKKELGLDGIGKDFERIVSTVKEIQNFKKELNLQGRTDFSAENSLGMIKNIDGELIKIVGTYDGLFKEIGLLMDLKTSGIISPDQYAIQLNVLKELVEVNGIATNKMKIFHTPVGDTAWNKYGDKKGSKIAGAIYDVKAMAPKVLDSVIKNAVQVSRGQAQPLGANFNNLIKGEYRSGGYHSDKYGDVQTTYLNGIRMKDLEKMTYEQVLAQVQTIMHDPEMYNYFLNNIFSTKSYDSAGNATESNEFYRKGEIWDRLRKELPSNFSKLLNVSRTDLANGVNPITNDMSWTELAKAWRVREHQDTNKIRDEKGNVIRDFFLEAINDAIHKGIITVPSDYSSVLDLGQTINDQFFAELIDEAAHNQRIPIVEGKVTKPSVYEQLSGSLADSAMGVGGDGNQYGFSRKEEDLFQKEINFEVIEDEKIMGREHKMAQLLITQSAHRFARLLEAQASYEDQFIGQLEEVNAKLPANKQMSMDTFLKGKLNSTAYSQYISSKNVRKMYDENKGTASIYEIIANFLDMSPNKELANDMEATSLQNAFYKMIQEDPSSLLSDGQFADIFFEQITPHEKLGTSRKFRWMAQPTLRNETQQGREFKSWGNFGDDDALQKVNEKAMTIPEKIEEAKNTIIELEQRFDEIGERVNIINNHLSLLEFKKQSDSRVLTEINKLEAERNRLLLERETILKKGEGLELRQKYLNPDEDPLNILGVDLQQFKYKFRDEINKQWGTNFTDYQASKDFFELQFPGGMDKFVKSNNTDKLGKLLQKIERYEEMLSRGEAYNQQQEIEREQNLVIRDSILSSSKTIEPEIPREYVSSAQGINLGTEVQEEIKSEVQEVIQEAKVEVVKEIIEESKTSNPIADGIVPDVTTSEIVQEVVQEVKKERKKRASSKKKTTKTIDRDNVGTSSSGNNGDGTGSGNKKGDSNTGEINYVKEYNRLLIERAKIMKEIEKSRKTINISYDKTEKNSQRDLLNYNEKILAVNEERIKQLNVEKNIENDIRKSLEEGFNQRVEKNTLEVGASKGGVNSLLQRLAGDVKRGFFRIFDFGVSYKLQSAIPNAIRKVIQITRELDASLRDLRIATGASRTEAEGLIKTYNQMGKTLGATTVEVAKSADSWLN